MARGRILELPDILRAAGITVVVHDGWANGGYGDLPNIPKPILHHDASRPGPSPGALGWIVNAVAAREAGAQVWIDYYGVWHLVASGVCWHAGKVGAGFPGNYDAFGIETDHTVDEAWPFQQLESVTNGLAAIAVAWGQDPGSWLYFHKQVAVPFGRKVDPAGLDIDPYRDEVRAAMRRDVTGTPATPTAPTPEEEDPIMAVADDLLNAVKALSTKVDTIGVELAKTQSELAATRKDMANLRKFANEIPDRTKNAVTMAGRDA